MIAYIEGKVIAKVANYLIINNAGIGYKVFCNHIEDVELNKNSYYFIHNHIREDSNDLYGFNTIDELQIFEKLISVSGVGPKVAMQIISATSVNSIVNAIAKSDASYFMSIPGIGKKVAAKIILDLKSKIGFATSNDDLNQINYENDVADALISLGYKIEEVNKIQNSIPADLKTPEAKIKWCLKNMSK